jgi:hypothetical protein
MRLVTAIVVASQASTKKIGEPVVVELQLDPMPLLHAVLYTLSITADRDQELIFFSMPLSSLRAHRK